MMTVYNFQMNDDSIQLRLRSLTNQIYKLLPERQQGKQWIKPLNTIIEEFAGMNMLFQDHNILFPLMCKLLGLKTLDKQQDFMQFRRIIFECLGMIGRMKDNVGPQ